MDKQKIVGLLTKSPNWLNIVILKLNQYPGLLFGKSYRTVFRHFYERKRDEEFLKFVNDVIDEVPFYARLHNGSEVRSIDEFFDTIQTIDKDTVLNDPESFIRVGADLTRADSVTTGGTSGKPMRILLPKSRFANEFGALHALWMKVGFRFDPRAVVRNSVLSKNRDFSVNPITKEFVFDGFRNDSQYYDIIFKTMRRFNIQFFHGYTSKAEQFVRHILSRGYDYSFLKAIITSSENFYDHQRKLFNELKGVEHLNFYGHTEKLLLGGWCESGGLYHFYNSYGFAELLDDEGLAVEEVGKIGELVGSTTYNTVMPLFRYRTGDYAKKGPLKCQACGFEGLSVSEILGRWNGERVFNADGSFVTTTSLNLHSDLYGFIDGLQYVQESAGELEIRVVPGSGFDSVVEERIRQDIARKLSEDSRVWVRQVPKIDRLPNGKFLLLLSHVEQAQSF